MKKLSITFLIIISITIFYGCKGLSPVMDSGFPTNLDIDILDDETIMNTKENPFVNAKTNANSVFSVHQSTASYTYLRNMINTKNRIDNINIRTEELVNYFSYNYEKANDDLISLGTNIMDCPWNSNSKLVNITVTTKEIEFSSVQNNIVFLVDVSGSMSGNRLSLVKQGLHSLLKNLNPTDKVSLVTYAGSDKVLLSGVSAADQVEISNTLDNLYASGSTHGSKGLITAYEIAQQHFIEGGNNRIILATDGDFNVGITNDRELLNLISEKRNTGIYISCVGVGMGNYKDSKMQTIADNGNGNYAYIDSIDEAIKFFSQEFGGNIITVAKDVKSMVEFNSDYVEKYRLLGYESRLLNMDDWNNSEKDAGDLGTNMSFTASYEIQLVDNYQTIDSTNTLGNSILKANIRCKDASTNTALEFSSALPRDFDTSSPTEDQLFISSVIEAGLLFINSDYKENANFENCIKRLQILNCVENDPSKQEFLTLLIKYTNN